MVGTGAAAGLDGLSWPRALLALLVALALQVGVNYANDYSDGLRGTDTDRVGPLRLTGSGAATPTAVRNAAFACFALASLAGLLLVAVSGTWELLVVGAAAVVAAWYYTGGRRPYGYLGLGELFVFVFFGLVAVLGTTYTQAGSISWPAVLGACGVGMLACAILVANNLRDIPTDSVTGKRTLAVVLGGTRSRLLYAGLVYGAYAAALAIVALHPGALLALVSIPLALRVVRRVRGGVVGNDLIAVLRDTGMAQLAYSALLGVGLAIS